MNDVIAALDMGEIGKPGWRPTKVHPLAALFPPLSDDDLQALAEDIRENGQIQPCMVDKDGVLIDGRSRLRACGLVEVDPWFDVLPDDADVEAYIWSANAKRRQIRKGQLAMVAAARLIPDAGKNDDDGTTELPTRDEIAKAAGVSLTRIDEALLVAKYARHLVDKVIAGDMTLDAAYAKAQEAKYDERLLKEGLALLRAEDRELAQKV
jgi:hypothetical protein